jgi:hypothetical protein
MPPWYIIAMQVGFSCLLLWSLTGIAENYFTQPESFQRLLRFHFAFGGAFLGIGIFMFCVRGEKQKFQQQNMEKK